MHPAVPWPKLSAIHTITLDFDGVFTDNKVYVGEDGTEWIRCDRADGLALDFLRTAEARGAIAADVFVLSKERNPVVEARAAKIRVQCYAAQDDKLAFMTTYFARTRPQDEDPFRGLLYVGNDLNDLPVMARAGFSVAPSDAHRRVQETASAVLPQRGGEGFVRAVVERLLDFDNLNSEDLNEFIRHR